MQLRLTCDWGRRTVRQREEVKGTVPGGVPLHILPMGTTKTLSPEDLGGTGKIPCLFSKLEPIITERLDNYSQLCLSPGLWCPNPALGRERAVTVWVFRKAMKVEAVPRRNTGRAHTPGPACSMINPLGPNLY